MGLLRNKAQSSSKKSGNNGASRRHFTKPNNGWHNLSGCTYDKPPLIKVVLNSTASFLLLLSLFFFVFHNTSIRSSKMKEVCYECRYPTTGKNSRWEKIPLRLELIRPPIKHNFARNVKIYQATDLCCGPRGKNVVTGLLSYRVRVFQEFFCDRLEKFFLPITTDIFSGILPNSFS